MAEVVTFERGHKIIISSSRRIQKGEEVLQLLELLRFLFVL